MKFPSSILHKQKEHTLATGQSLMANAPIDVALNKMSAEEKTCLSHKFDIAYFLAMETIIS